MVLEFSKIKNNNSSPFVGFPNAVFLKYLLRALQKPPRTPPLFPRLQSRALCGAASPPPGKPVPTGVCVGCGVLGLFRRFHGVFISVIVLRLTVSLCASALLVHLQKSPDKRVLERKLINLYVMGIQQR